MLEVCDICGQIPKSIYQDHTLYLVIFSTILPRLVLEKTNVEVSFKKTKKDPCLNPKNIFQKNMLSEESVKLPKIL